MNGKPTPLFEIVNDFIGWGDPGPSGLWFIGLEGGAPFKKENSEKIRAEYGKRFVAESEWNWKELKQAGAGIRDYTSKISQPLSAKFKNATWDKYRDKRLWAKDAKVFQANLFPLGKPKLTDWMPDYEEMFGFGPMQREHYEEFVRQTRFPKINEFRKENYPQGTICFGSGSAADFRACLSLENDNGRWLDDQNKIQCFEDERVLIVPFFGMGKMSDTLKDIVVQQLMEWDVILP